MKITKEITFDCAHMLSNYDGKCNNLHGHTYKLQVTLEGKTSKNTYMVIDFNKLKSILDSAVMQKFDHAIIFSGADAREESENELLRWVVKYHKKSLVLESGKTTCENMVPYIKEFIKEELAERDLNFSVSIRLWETPTSFAEA